MNIPVYAGVESRSLPSGISYTETDSRIEEFFKDHETTSAAIAVAVFDRNEVICENSFGYQDKEAGLKVDADTVFEWGSISKLLVWVSVMQLKEMGALDLSADIRTYLPTGFLQNLSYDKPLTLIDLMNHQGGFQDIIHDLYVKDPAEVLSLGTALKESSPAQIYEPGTVTAYSNWSTSLAGYIVELVSGMPFSQYVSENIFKPLGMDQTALSADLSDNEWVRNQRQKIKGYSPGGQLQGESINYISLYPSGMCTGTLSDLRKFAQALNGNNDRTSPLFANKSTYTELLTPTAYYGTSGIPSNYHGFWSIELGVPVMGHSGNTAGFTANLLIDQASGIGAVVMTNQVNEMIFSQKMMELIFGSFSDSGLSAINATVPSGLFRKARTITQGPLSILSASLYPLSGQDPHNFVGIAEVNGITKVVYPYVDAVKLTPGQYIPIILLVLSLGSGILYALLTLLISGLIMPLVRRSGKTTSGRRISPLRKWTYLACGLILLFVSNLVLLIFQLGRYIESTQYLWQFALNGVIALAMAALIFVLFIQRKQLRLAPKSAVMSFITALFLAMNIAAILYWQLYAFWAL